MGAAVVAAGVAEEVVVAVELGEAVAAVAAVAAVVVVVVDVVVLPGVGQQASDPSF